jgi:hypothetical protein
MGLVRENCVTTFEITVCIPIYPECRREAGFKYAGLANVGEHFWKRSVAYSMSDSDGIG